MFQKTGGGWGTTFFFFFFSDNVSCFKNNTNSFLFQGADFELNVKLTFKRFSSNACEVTLT